MKLQLLCEEVVVKKIPHQIKNGKIYFNGVVDQVKFVRYIYEKKDTLEIDLYVCLDKPFGTEQTPEDRKTSAREKNRWIRDEFNTWDLTHKFEEWKPQSQAVTPAANPPAVNPTAPKPESSDDFDWSFVEQSGKTDDENPFGENK